MSVEKAFDRHNGHALALIACRSDGLRGWAVGHYGINVYLVAAGITRRAAQASCLLRTINQARLPVARRLEACATSDRQNDARFRSRIEFLCPMRIDRTSRLVFSITSAVAGSLIFCLTIAVALAAPAEPSPPSVTPTPEAKPSPVVVFSITSRNSLKGGRELSGKNLRHSASA